MVDLDPDFLNRIGLQFAPGLTDKKVEQIEATFGFIFPPDLRQFLQYGLPVGKRFVDWRNGSEDDIRHLLDWPFDGIRFDIEMNNFWMDEWGEKPAELDDAGALAEAFVEKTPKLIPVYAHRYIPDRPNEPGNPVFSVHQTDIIIYGVDLKTYLSNEFGCGRGSLDFQTDNEKYIEFWSELVEQNNLRIDDF